jgi:hypothetical protein
MEEYMGRKKIYDYSVAKQMYESGMEPVEIANIIGCQIRSVYKQLNAIGVKLRGQLAGVRKAASKKYLPHKDGIEKLTSEGLTASEIAKELGIHNRQVDKCIQLFDLPKPSQKRYRGDKSPSWKGGYKSYHGYIRVRCPDHPFVATDGYVPQHRLVMEESLGRYLLQSEHVHHIDGDRSNNLLSNLMLLSNSDHGVYNTLCSKCTLRNEIKILKRQLDKALSTCNILLKDKGGVNGIGT